MSVASAPPRKPVFLVWGSYGAISGSRSHPRARLWLLTDEHDNVESPVLCRIAWNSPISGCVEYEDLGEVTHARIRDQRLAEVWTSSGQVSLVIAPCVCGAGSVGNALPDEGRISLNYVNPYNRPRLSFV
jgi:hypothetical protein